MPLTPLIYKAIALLFTTHPLSLFPQVYRETLPPSEGWSSLYSPPLHNSGADSFLVRAMLRDGDAGFFQQVI